MPSPKNPTGPEVYTPMPQQTGPLKPGETTATQTHTLDVNAQKAAPLKLPQLRADERTEKAAPPANENNTLLLMQSWQRGTRALAAGSKQHLPSIIMFCGATVSAMWLAAAGVYIHNVVGWQNIKNLMPHEIGGFLAGLLAPVALFWMLLTFWLRSVDVKLYAEALRSEIQRMIFPSDEAERRVNNDIERLVRQTAEMSRATRMALGTLQQARQAVQSETQSLQNSTHEATERLGALEQRLGERHRNLNDLQNTFSQKGQALEKTAAQLITDATTLDRLVEQTSGKTTTIGQTLQAPIKQLQNWQDDIVDTLNASLAKIADKQGLLKIDVQNIEDKAEQLAQTLQSGTAKLYDFTDDALDKAKLIETRLQGQGLSLQETLTHIAAQTESLTKQRDKLLQELAASSDNGRVQLADQVTLLNDTTQQLQKTHDTVADQMRALWQGSYTHADQLNGQLQKAHDAVAIQMNSLWQGTQDKANQLNGGLQKTQQAIADQMHALWQQAQEQADKLNVDIQKTQNNVTSQMENLWQGAYTHVNRLNEDVQNVLEKAGESWQTQANQFSAHVRDNTIQHAELLTQTQTGLKAGYDTLQADLDEVARKVHDLMRNTKTDMHAISHSVKDDITQQQDQIKIFVTELLQNHQQSTRTSADDLTRLQNELNRLTAELAQRGENISTHGEQAASLLHALNESLERSLGRVTTTTAQLQNNVTATATAFDAPLEKLDQAAQHAHSQAQVIGNMLDQRVTNLYELGGALTNQASLLGADLTAKSQILETVLTRIQGDVKTISSEVTAQTNVLDSQVRVTLDQVNSLVPQIKTIQQNFAIATEQAQSAHSDMVRLTDVTKANSQQLIDVSEQTVNRIAQSLSSYKDLHETYQMVNNSTLEQHVKIRQSYQQDIDMIQTNAGQMKSEAERASQHYQTLRNVLQGLQQEAQQSQALSAQTQEKLQLVQKEIVQTGQSLQQQADNATQNIRIVQQILDGSAQSTLNHVNNLTASVGLADKQSHQIQERIEKLSELAQKQTGLVDTSVSRLIQATANAGETINTLAGFDTTLTRMQGTIRSQHDYFADQQSNVEKNVVDALSKLQAQTNLLAQTTYDASQQAEAVRAQDQALQRDYFFSATKFIVESLHSLALDFTRMLDGELPDKTWKAYKQGDTAVFTKRLAAMRDTISHDKLRQKFAEDFEFRTYVQRYIRQFEDIFNQAKQQDYGDLLSGVFSSSDVGRLYQLLKTVTSD